MYSGIPTEGFVIDPKLKTELCMIKKLTNYKTEFIKNFVLKPFFVDGNHSLIYFSKKLFVF